VKAKSHRAVRRRRGRQHRADVAKKSATWKVLAIDVGGTSVKILATGQNERRSFPSGPTLTPRRMVSGVKKLARGWTYNVVSIGYPGPVLHGRPIAEPHNLGRATVIVPAAMRAARALRSMTGSRPWRMSASMA
jgi:predicted NBD/HSP70 family sugar kinase